MSLAIDVSRVARVRIDGQDYDVLPGTFHVDTYEFTEPLLGGEETDVQTLAVTVDGWSNKAGFMFWHPAKAMRYREGIAFPQQSRMLVMGPLSAIQALAYAPEEMQEEMKTLVAANGAVVIEV